MGSLLRCELERWAVEMKAGLGGLVSASAYRLD